MTWVAPVIAATWLCVPLGLGAVVLYALYATLNDAPAPRRAWHWVAEVAIWLGLVTLLVTGSWVGVLILERLGA